MYANADGTPVEDLKADEIELREDGVAQNIETFEHVVVRPAGPQETRSEPNTVAESRQMACRCAGPGAGDFSRHLPHAARQLGSHARAADTLS
jgi:hypothetical protein